MISPEFVGFPKIPRLRRSLVVTEKIDGTNACVYVPEDGGPLLAGSRTRWITPEDDNYGFAKWVAEHAEELRGLGPGTHFGEWWGQGIQRRYDLDHKRFSLFNAGRWGGQTPAPPCCHVVPVLGVVEAFHTESIEALLQGLQGGGSRAAPGFMRPEGIVLYHAQSRNLYKITLEKDDEPKGLGG